MGGGERGKDGGGVDLNLGTPTAAAEARGLSSAEEAKSSEKEVVMNGCVEKVKLLV